MGVLSPRIGVWEIWGFQGNLQCIQGRRCGGKYGSIKINAQDWWESDKISVGSWWGFCPHGWGHGV